MIQIGEELIKSLTILPRTTIRHYENVSNGESEFNIAHPSESEVIATEGFISDHLRDTGFIPEGFTKK